MFLGSVNDINLSEFPENFIYQKLTQFEWIMADRGFKGLMHLRILSYSEFKDSIDSRLYKSIRSVVENHIGMIKKWKICDLQFRNNLGKMNVTLEYHHQVWVVCAILDYLFGLSLRWIY